MKVIGPLSDPTAYGANASDAFHLVFLLYRISLFCRADHPGRDPIRITKAWVGLMERLGYYGFVAQGGDWGAKVKRLVCLRRRR